MASFVNTSMDINNDIHLQHAGIDITASSAQEDGSRARCDAWDLAFASQFDDASMPSHPFASTSTTSATAPNVASAGSAINRGGLRLPKNAVSTQPVQTAATAATTTTTPAAVVNAPYINQNGLHLPRMRSQPMQSTQPTASIQPGQQRSMAIRIPSSPPAEPVSQRGSEERADPTSNERKQRHNANLTRFRCRFGCFIQDKDKIEGARSGEELRAHMYKIHQLFPNSIQILQCDCGEKFGRPCDYNKHRRGKHWCKSRFDGSKSRYNKPYPRTREERADTWALEVDGPVDNKLIYGREAIPGRSMPMTNSGNRNNGETAKQVNRVDNLNRAAQMPGPSTVVPGPSAVVDLTDDMIDLTGETESLQDLVNDINEVDLGPFVQQPTNTMGAMASDLVNNINEIDLGQFVQQSTNTIGAMASDLVNDVSMEFEMEQPVEPSTNMTGLMNDEFEDNYKAFESLDIDIYEPVDSQWEQAWTA